MWTRSKVRVWATNLLFDRAVRDVEGSTVFLGGGGGGWIVG